MSLFFHKARRTGLEAIVSLLVSESLGQTPPPLQPAYASTFAAIDTLPDQLLAVVIAADKVIGTLQAQQTRWP